MLKLFFSKKPEEVLESINGITLSETDIAKFGNVVGDYSPLHRDLETARKFGFDNIPVIGVHLASIGGRISRDLLSIMQTPEANLVYAGQNVTFRDPVYPNEPINWKIQGQEERDGSQYFTLAIPNADPTKKPRVELVSEFRTERPVSQQYDISRLVYREEVEFKVKEIKEFYECLREEPLKEIDFCHAGAKIPSTLLSFLKELNQINGTEIGGKNIEMSSRAYGEIETGMATIDVYEVDKKGRGNKVFYTFEGVLNQNGTPRVSSIVRTLTNGELDIRALRSKLGLAA